MLKKLILGSSAASMVAVSGYIAFDIDRRYGTSKVLTSSARIFRMVSTATLIALDYAVVINFNKWRSKSDDEMTHFQDLLCDLAHEQEKFTIVQLTTTDPAKLEDMNNKIKQTRQKMNSLTEQITILAAQNPQGQFKKCHIRSAARIRDMCAVNRGIYIKIGQHLAMLDYVLPEEYTQILSTLLSQTPQTSWDDVQIVLTEEFGQDAAMLFDSIDPTPIASASLAQVHIAYKNGKKLAVKVQHRGLREESVYDAIAITQVVKILGRLFESFSYEWLTKEMNMNLPIELDFLSEVRNLKRATFNLKSLIDRGDLVIPAVHEELSSTRVVTMDFESGVYMSDKDSIIKLGLRPSDVAKIVSTTFCEQIYIHGFVHCDPHPANLLVRPHASKKGKPTIVLLDHGLYRELDDFFRLEYCRLWEGIVLGDKQEIKRACIALNVGPAYTLLAAMLTMRPWDDIVNKDREKLINKTSNSDSEMLKVYAQRYYHDIIHLLGRADSELLLLLKTNDCLRHLDKRLGAPINTIKIVAQITGDVLIVEELWPSKGIARRVREVQNETVQSNEEYKRKRYSELFTKEDKAFAEANKEFITTADADSRPESGIGFWFHTRTQRAFLRYLNMQLRRTGLSLIDWTLWLSGIGARVDEDERIRGVVTGTGAVTAAITGDEGETARA